jgi:intracellular sulfur oxidation DsrE/DsrF family protein
MVMASTSGRLMASSLSLLLLSCSGTRHSVPGPSGAHELGKYILIIESAPDGQAVHSWKPVDDFNLMAHPHAVAPRSVQGRIVQAAFNRNCEDERDACERMCLAGLKGRAWSHMSVGSKKEHCVRACMQPYLDCCTLRELAKGKAVEFHAMDEAVEWLKQNSDRLLVGAVVVIAGVAFVVTVGGGGFLLLAPVIAFTSSDVASGSRALAVKP